MVDDYSLNTMNHSGINEDNGIWYAKEMPEALLYKPPEKSEWKVWLMGDHKEKGRYGAIVYHPNKGQEPNWFHRKMQELCFGFQWRKE
jgi:hypothetical protein